MICPSPPAYSKLTTGHHHVIPYPQNTKSWFLHIDCLYLPPFCMNDASSDAFRPPIPIDSAALENRLFPPVTAVFPQKRQMLHGVSSPGTQKKGVTLMLLWHEYKQANPDGYPYNQFCELHRQWRKTLDVCLRQEYRE